VKQSKIFRNETWSVLYTNDSITLSMKSLEILGAAHTLFSLQAQLKFLIRCAPLFGSSNKIELAGLFIHRIDTRWQTFRFDASSLYEKFGPLTSTFPILQSAPQPFSPARFLLIAYGNYCLHAKYVDTHSWIVSKSLKSRYEVCHNAL